MAAYWRSKGEVVRASKLSKLERAVLHRTLAEERGRYKIERAQIAADERRARSERALAFEGAKQECKSRAQSVREQADHAYEYAVQLAKAAREAARKAQRDKCALRKAHIREEAAAKIAAAKRERDEEQRFRRQLGRMENWGRTRQGLRSKAKERRRESDDEVVSNIEPRLVPLWEQVKRTLRGSERKSRTEAFLEYVEAHPGEVVEAQLGGSERAQEHEFAGEYARHLEEQAERRRPLRKTRARRRHSAAEFEAAVPF